MTELVFIDAGRRPYAETLRLQEALLAQVRAGERELAYLLLVEHDPPAITVGRGRGRDHIVATPQQLADEGVELHETARGGDVTYHGPGQLVGYPIIRVDRHGRDVHKYLRDLEEVLIRLLGRFGIGGGRREGLTGIWVGREKIAAIGVAFRRWVSYHGFALNVMPKMSHFDLIVPCGIAGEGVTSMAAVLGRSVSVDEVKQPLVECVADVFGFATPGERKSARRAAERTAGTAPSAAEARCPAGNGRTNRRDRPRGPGRLPPWLTRRLPAGADRGAVAGILAELGLSTVCTGAHCPNQAECFARGSAAFLILGECCTRNCRFCAIPPGRPNPPAPDEPEAVAEACARMGLRHVVVTSVTRDDLPDGGAGHFARTVRAVRRRAPQTVVEVLTPDFQGRTDDVDTVLDAGVDIFNHNMETVRRLYPAVRPQADYARSLGVIAHAAGRAGPNGRKPCIKSGLMVGLGESHDEVRRVLRDLRRAGCDIVTIGQYLAPSPSHAPVARFVEPAEFEAWRAEAEEMGFAAAAAGPFVRSSYRAQEVFDRRQV